MLVMIIGLTMAVTAQKHQDPKKPPPKQNPPVVTPNIKKPPKGEDKPKKPESAQLAPREEIWTETE